MQCAVELLPVPAMTGQRPPTVFTACEIASRCSCSLSVGVSPVVPQMTMESVPFCSWNSMSSSSFSKLMVRSGSIGVTMATPEPVKTGAFMIFTPSAMGDIPVGAQELRQQHTAAGRAAQGIV